ncbi:MAG TPA: NTP transferase domain-containing protein [Syntrophales bacterium]|nr:NTP transferase domain-containing protein [Syntrophales bacterium]HPQ44099.1 NTP transferase domain-containing protein [Syntrophales bacterium]
MKKDTTLTALILSAGYSSRMNELKPLLSLNRSLVVEHTITCFRRAGINDIRVVLGYRAGDLVPIVDRHGVRYILNDRFKEGMYSSIRKGVESFERNIEAFFLLPVDMPIVDSETIKKLAVAYSNTGARIIYPCFQGFRGHPPLIATEYIQEILTTEQPDGMRGLLRRHEKDAVDIEAEDLGILIDINTPFEYRHLLDLDSSRTAPTLTVCYNLLRDLHVSEKIINHSQKVAAIARKIAAYLNRHGFGLDLSLIEASALLHDIAKGRRRHDQTGSEIILKLGYPKVAAIVGSHVNIDLVTRDYLDEAEVIYLADKLVQENRIVPLQNRFAGARELFKDNPEIIEAVEQRFQNAETILQRIEKINGEKIYNILGDSPYEPYHHLHHTPLRTTVTPID